MTTQNDDADIDRRKRLGQFFSGVRLAGLLASIARADDAKIAIDPMAGSGDMLAACAKVGQASLSLVGIEIDPAVAARCRDRLSVSDLEMTTVDGNAFDPRSWEGLPPAFDLVITNPPYVRYQLGSDMTVGPVEVPNAREVRAALVACLNCTVNLQPSERAIFLECAKGYSGLSDLAVPSWILCAARVSLGGTLAIVVPNTWLSRDYAAPVLYLLRRFFEIDFVIEDSDVVWFPDALARTTLVIARRVGDKGTAYGAGGHLRVSIPAALSDERSLVSGLFPGAVVPDRDFAVWAHARKAEKASGQFGSVDYSWSMERDLERALRHAASKHDWLPAPGPERSLIGPQVPERLEFLLTDKTPILSSLQDLGWKVGQGLRTGGNDFFYVSKHPSGIGYQSVLLPGEQLDLPAAALRPAVRRQAELPSDASHVVLEPSSSVLYLANWALPEDFDTASGPAPWLEMQGDLARLVRTAALKVYKRPSGEVRLSELTAVRTNARAGAAGRAARFWYQLPELAARHTPDLYLPRVNGGLVTPYLNPDRSLTIDANFSSLWAFRPDALDIRAMLALLSSSWTHAYLETTGTIMGGGALKVEATHLRRLVVPTPDSGLAKTLAQLVDEWRQGPMHKKIWKQVDSILAKQLSWYPEGSSLSDFTSDCSLKRTGRRAIQA
ncbi:MAG: N-6 DNA methylase [Myxococcota bacterium]|nr:N-6 DNA methylase [Myxococcota bacterium]